uniref:tetratricopeptide repeat protein n=1 Tax=Hassallia byssoidea TaxID=482630 RepID=UPI0007C77432|nr:tetratricopeptide repeat protein [Hassalia byssoidea]
MTAPKLSKTSEISETPETTETEKNWLVVAKNRWVNRDWEALMQRHAENSSRCYHDLHTAPTNRQPGRVFSLKGKKYKGVWEYEVSKGDRVFYIPNEEGVKLYQEGQKLEKKGTKEAYQQAIEKYQQALKIAQELGLRKEEFNLLIKIAGVYSSKFDNKNAIEHLKKALDISQQLKQPLLEAIVFGLIGNKYINSNNPKEGLTYL